MQPVEQTICKDSRNGNVEVRIELRFQMLKREFLSQILCMWDRAFRRAVAEALWSLKNSYLSFSSEIYRGKLGKEEINSLWFVLVQFSFDKTILSSLVCILSI